MAERTAQVESATTRMHALECELDVLKAQSAENSVVAHQRSIALDAKVEALTAAQEELSKAKSELEEMTSLKGEVQQQAV
eukprot:CAMPEP_0169249734 /NCGR_PEP_ID=MMETSP1016-20121227/36562_1 /TAXON_ID=342587 /ORGANISM="Karlodinium micrum, Strain CCMP2283" /LENGTH=79 /DNA_ID=CAMNT_0009330673 /DNA_START=1 /DNA_END=237 /DNA_ORIENTATION=+